jgi:hypothetical protein
MRKRSAENPGAAAIMTGSMIRKKRIAWRRSAEGKLSTAGYNEIFGATASRRKK